MVEKDYYKLLGVDKNSGKEDIKKAYKKLAMKYHPDRAPDDKKKEYEEKFKEMSEAAAVLSDDKKRQQYDQFGSSSFSGGSGFQGYDYSDIMSQFRSGSFGNFEDVFEQVFGGFGGRKGSRGRRGNDLLYETTITLEEVATGSKQTIQLNKLEHCEECHGKGALSFESCHHCKGSGHVERTQRTPFGIFRQSGPCPNCHGQGELPEESCPSCDGEGLTRRKKKIEISIPAGVEEGMRLRVAGEGEIGENNGPAGVLYVMMHITEHKGFSREANNITLTVPLSFTQAVLGDEIDVPTLEGTARLTIPAGTQSETIFRMRGKGLPSVHDHQLGDEMVKVRIQVPQKLNKKQIELIKQMQEEKPSKGFFERVF